MVKRLVSPSGSTLEERLALHSEPRIPGRCQLWLGAKTSDGYGRLQWNGRTSRVTRLTWEIERGPIPPGLHVLHHCDNPPCRNIEHLFLGTNLDNVADKVAKGRQDRTSYPGESNGNVKLSGAQVLQIRAIPASITQREIAALYGVSRETVSKIRLRKTWTYL
jgi:HNH endonuclease